MIWKRKNCRVCFDNKKLKLLWDFGMTPLANSYLAVNELDKPEYFFPLQVMQCGNCGNIQLSHVVEPKILFSNYLYESSTSPVFVKHFEDFARKMGKKKFVIDIGGNDGILLRPFRKKGSRVLNIEPARNIKAENIPTIHRFFTLVLAKQLFKTHPPADLITATNVFAHVDDLDQIVEGVKILLAKGGLFVVEVADFDQMLKAGSFDLIYHEHLNYWSEDTIRKFFLYRGMEVVDVEHIPVHGGSLRVYARLPKQN